MAYSEVELKAYVQKLFPDWKPAAVQKAINNIDSQITNKVLDILLENPAEPDCSLILALFDKFKSPLTSIHTANSLLIKLACLYNSPNPEINKTIRNFLKTTNTSEYARNLFSAWNYNRDVTLFELILQEEWFHFLKDTPWLQLPILLKANKLTTAQYIQKFEHLFHRDIQGLLNVTRDKNPEIAQRARAILLDLPTEWLQKNVGSTEKINDSKIILLNLLADVELENTALIERVKLLISFIKKKGMPSWYLNSLWTRWLEERNPHLAEALLKNDQLPTEPLKLRVMSALKMNRPQVIEKYNYWEIQYLLEACSDSDSQIAQTARNLLLNMSSAKLDNLAKLWLDERSELLENIFRETGYLPRKPLEARVFLALRLDKEKELLDTVGKSDIIGALAAACEDTDLKIKEAARRLLPDWLTSNPNWQKLLCKAILGDEYPFAAQIALEKGYEPSEAVERTLYLFFTGQWERYEGLDYEFRILRTTYENAEPKNRQRIAAKIRQSGRAEFLTIISGGEQRSRAEVLNLEEAEVIVRNLSDNGNWNKLWELVFELPLHWSVAATRRLAAAHWQPENDEAKKLFAQLKELVQGEIITTQAEAIAQLPPAVLRAQLHVNTDAANPVHINDIAFSPVGHVLAVGLSRKQLVLWNWQTGKLEATIPGFANGVGRVAFLPDNSLLCSDAAPGWQTPTRIYHYNPAEKDNALKELAKQQGAINALAVADDDKVIWGAQDRQTVLWDIRENIILEIYKQHNIWVRHVLLPKHQNWVALLHDGITLLKFPEFSELRHKRFSSLNRPNILAACFAPDEKSLVISRAEKRLGYCELADVIEPDDINEFDIRYFGEHRPQENVVVGLSSIPGLPILLAVSERGTVEFINWDKKEIAWKLQIPGEKTTAFRLSPDGYFMAVAEANQGLTLWDLRVLELQRFFAASLAQGRGPHMAALTIFEQSETTANLPPAVQVALRYLKLILEKRARFDIELEDFSSIQAGTFDIEL